MADDSAVELAQPTEGPREPGRPDPPPFNPDMHLIGYVEKGQQPPSPAAPPRERRP